MTVEVIEAKRKELMDLCKRHDNCVGCPLDNEGCKALEILNKNFMDYESIFNYLKEKEN